MATKYAVLRGIEIMQENFPGTGVRQVARCTFDTPAYTAATDLDAMTFSGERDVGADASPTLATAIQNSRRDNKTVTLAAAITAMAGRSSAGVAFYAAFITSVNPATPPSYGLKVSSGNLLGSLCSAANVDQTTAASTGGGHPITIDVSYDLS